MSKKQCILDVDGILWDFHRVLAEVIDNMYGKHFEIADMSRWDWYEDHMSESQFYKAVDLVHEEHQLSNEPFPGADDLLEVLDNKKYEIIVASHRKKGAASTLSAWLMLYLPEVWSGLYAGPDKTFLIKPDSLVIDDNPVTIKYAQEVGARVATLEYPWNASLNVKKFETTKELVDWIRSKP